MDHIEDIRREITYIRPHEHEDDDWYFEGEAFLELGRFGDAELKFKELMLSQPEHPDGYQGLALTYERLGCLDKAAFFISEAVNRAQVFFDDDALDPEVMDDMLASQRRINLKREMTQLSRAGSSGAPVAGAEPDVASGPRLSDIVDEMEMITDFRNVYLNRRTGETARFSDDDLHAAEHGGDTHGLPDWQAELVDQAREVLSSNDYVELPTSYDIHEYRIMEGFCHSLSDARVRDELLVAIRGRGAFRCFRDAIHRLQIADGWYSHRRRAIRDMAVVWLEENDIEFVGDDGAERAPPN